ncbi:Lrp/AsnC family transcriptional regulator [Agromyces endophyticus]|uniref:Lrp/AsnC family transcriptional regulator n=1 Tax=Agromyces sp. H17E-10 TaxID=2932244 RepID=UPI001FD075D6|nr:Lrp/AsnC family transcriptional regulator [Agromyces sp. H17E-10]UOQ89123.1 Lrp/AsnC family transcriptional regulator [Agromyces sp. H17E-10]
MNTEPAHGRNHDYGLDEIDRQLLTLLQKDGRLSYSELGDATGLSAGAARARVLKLQDDGTLQIVGVTDPLRLGYRNMAMLAINVDGDIDEAADAIGRVNGVIYVILAAGSVDLLVEVIASSSDELYEIINRHLRTIPGVRAVETFTYYRTHTHRFAWGAVPD